MKKLLSVLLSVVLLMGTFSAITFAEDEIIGLNENLDELIMKNYFAEEELAEIDKNYKQDYSEYLINEYIPSRQSTNKMETNSVDEEYTLLMKEGELDYDCALRVTNLPNFTYSDQYARLGCFEYLFDGKEYWNVKVKSKTIASSLSRFEINGERIEDIEEYLGLFSEVLKQQVVFELIEGKKVIKNLLLKKGETTVEEIKIYTIGSAHTGLYIKCPEQEYILKVYDYSWESYKKLDDEYYEFMTAGEMAEVYEQSRYDRNKTYVTPAKFTYEMEAEALQAEGLLLGTEKGLELLKPLTRAEAATILLRALGESTEANAAVQTFSDVGSDYWGYGAVENSYKLGIMNGIGDNLFAPEDMVTAAQFSTMVLRASGTNDFNWETALDLLIENEVISQTDASTMDFFARCDMAKIIYEAKAKGLF